VKIVRKTDRFLGGIDLLLLSTVQPYPKYSVVVPVFNRPDELAELLHSLTQQTIRDFEVIVVEDGSDISSKAVCDKFRNQLELHYYTKANTGPGPSRNFGVEKARGEYVVFFDSDCILPPTYFACVETFMQAAPVDAWGGPDRGHENFTPLQQAMACTMSSWLRQVVYAVVSRRIFSPAVLIWAFAGQNQWNWVALRLIGSQKTLSSVSACANRE
jgi:glycosyltransferase involved in cell wall biosynthesis